VASTLTTLLLAKLLLIIIQSIVHWEYDNHGNGSLLVIIQCPSVQALVAAAAQYRGQLALAFMPQQLMLCLPGWTHELPALPQPQPLVVPAAVGICAHLRTDFRGSNRYARRETCRDCGELINVVMHPQQVY
jgi:hypothetical protein